MFKELGFVGVDEDVLLIVMVEYLKFIECLIVLVEDKVVIGCLFEVVLDIF